jgi:hypothetical protein
MGHITIPYQTLHSMDLYVRADQGKTYRSYLRKVLPHIEDAYRGDEDGFRSHLGASILGQECGRAIWYAFRWATKSSFSGSMLRLFNRGHLEEGRFIALLLTIGCEVYQQDQNGKQFRITHADGHMGGSGDGVVAGIPDLPKEHLLGEFKTHNEKSFDKLAGTDWRKHLEWYFGQAPVGSKPVPFNGEGVKEAKPEHYVQMQTYMRKMQLGKCLYVAVNKNTDDIYCEIVAVNPFYADEMLQRGERLVAMDQPPKKLNESPGYYKCRFCDHKPVCHLNKPPERNCRTCAFSNPVLGEPGAQWECRLRELRITKDIQLVGCDQYVVKKGF